LKTSLIFQDRLKTHNIISRATFAKILHHMLTNGRFTIDDPIYGFQLICLGMIDFRRRQWHLLLSFFAHFVAGSFFYFVVISVHYHFLIYYKKKCHCKIRFFYLFRIVISVDGHQLKRLWYRYNEKSNLYQPSGEPIIRRVLQAIDAEAVFPAVLYCSIRR